MSYIEESQAAGRHVLPDLVRAFAVLGIVLVNVAYLAYPGAVTYPRSNPIRSSRSCLGLALLIKCKARRGEKFH